MTQTTAPIAFTDEGFEALLATREEPVWVTELRREGWQRFQQLAWPSHRDEEWVRTDIRLFQLAKFAMDAEVAPQEVQPALTAGVELGGQLMGIDGQLHKFALADTWKQRGVLFGPLSTMLSEHGDRLRPYFQQRAFRGDADRFAALQSAFWRSGGLVLVPRGVHVEQPLHIMTGLSHGHSDISHALIVLEEGATATILTETASPHHAAAGFHCGATEVYVGRGAHLRFVSLQDWGQGVWHFAHQKAIVDRDASIQWTVGALGSRLSKVNQHVELVGDGAECQVNGVMFTENKQHLSYHTLQHHRAASCRSDFLYKAALQDHSRTVWRGMIKVDPGAQKTDGYQRNDNLLLSHTARADSIPGLEIEADDVRCTHGSTSGRVDEELIFYAKARGFTRHEAIQMIVTGFFQQVFDRITIESVREALGQAIARRVREYE